MESITDFGNKSIDNKETILKNFLTDPNNFLKDFQKFRKLLSNCAIGDGVSVDQIVEDIKDMTKGGSEFSKFMSDPNKVVCFSTAMVGLTLFAEDTLKKLNLNIKSYYKGFLPYLSDLMSEIAAEINPGEITSAIKNSLNNAAETLVDVGAGFVFSETQKLETYEDKILYAYQNIGKYFSFLYTASKEFRYLMSLIFINEVKKQTGNRIQNLVNLKNAIDFLIYDVDISNSDEFAYNKKLSLENYTAALQTLEDGIYITKDIEKKIIQFNQFDDVLNNELLYKVKSAESLLLLQKNDFLEQFLDAQDIEVNSSDNKYLYYLSNNYSTYSGLDIISTKSFETTATNSDKINFLNNLDSINKIYFNIRQEDILVNTNLNNSNYISTDQYIWVGLDKKISLNQNDLCVIKDNFFSVSQIDFITVDNIEIQLLKLNYENSDFYVKKFNELNNNKISFIKEINFQSENRSQDFVITDDSYSLIETPGIDKLNTIIIGNDANTEIKNEWGDSKDYVYYIFLKYSPGFKIIKLKGIYPNFVEIKKSKINNAFNELPEPYKSLYNTYKDVQSEDFKIKPNDYFNIIGSTSNFLFGKDIVHGPYNKFGKNLNSYDGFIKSASTVLEAFCPLKNTVVTYYSSLDSLSKFTTKTEDIVSETNKKWVLHLNRIIEDTIRSMTLKDGNGNYLTIEQIKESPLYIKLFPSLLLDYNNIKNLENLISLNLQLGEGLNINSNLDKKFDNLYDIINWLDSGNYDELKNLEVVMWDSLNSSLIYSLVLILKGEQVSNIKPIIDNIYKNIELLILKLNDLYTRLSVFGDDSFTSERRFINLLESMGLKSFVDNNIKNGKIDNFINTNVSEWAGRYGPAVSCLRNILNQFTGYEKVILNKVMNYLNYINIAELTTNFELGNLDFGHSINLNFITKIPESTKNQFHNLAVRRSLSMAALDSIRKKLSN